MDKEPDGPARRWTKAAAVAAAALVATGVVGGAPVAAATAPGPVTNVVWQANIDDGLQVAWLLPPDADGAVVCVYVTAAPPAPVAGANGCSPVVKRSAHLGWPEDEPGIQRRVAVFSHSSATGEFGPAAFDTDEVPPPFGASGLSSRGVDETRLDLTFDGGEDMGLGGTTTWVVRQAVGSTAPNEAAAPVREAPATPRPQFGPYRVRVGGLRPSTAYTFSVQGRDARGNLSEALVTHTTVTRTPGAYVQENRHERRRGARARVTSAAPRSGPDPAESAMAVTPSTGRVHLAYLVGQPGGNFDLSYANRLPTGRWSAATRLARGSNLGDLTLTRSRRGTLAVSWSDGFGQGCWRTQRLGARWGGPSCLATSRQARQMVIDRSDRLHLLYRRSSGPASRVGLWYRTNARGGWSEYRVAGNGVEVERLAIDPVTDRLVLVVGRQAGARWLVQVATKQPRSTRFGALRTRATGTQADSLRPTSVTSYGGRITVALQRTRGFDLRQSFGRPRLMTGTTAATVGGLTLVGGTTSADSRLVVAAESSSRVLLAWSRRAAAVDGPAQGVWASRRTLAKGRWTFSAPSHRTTSAFDVPSAAASDGRGSVYLAFRRLATDDERLR